MQTKNVQRNITNSTVGCMVRRANPIPESAFGYNIFQLIYHTIWFIDPQRAECVQRNVSIRSWCY